MSDAVISRRGSSGSSTRLLRTDMITSTSNYTIPNAINNTFSVRIFGGGGGRTVARLRGGGGGGLIAAMPNGARIYGAGGPGGSGICIIQYYV